MIAEKPQIGWCRIPNEPVLNFKKSHENLALFGYYSLENEDNLRYQS
jgi:hypothetical protein